MSPLAKLLQIKPQPEQQKSVLGKIWANFVAILRSTKIQRRVRRLEVVERVNVGNKQSVVLVRVDQREFMVGCSGDAVVLLAPPPATAITVEKVKMPAKRKPRTKSVQSKSAQRQALVPVAPAAEPVKVRRVAKKENASVQIELPLKQRVPSKASLVNAFARRAQ
jgi:flagellar biogenesis protein FliO